MANQAQYAFLQQGVAGWNRWRKEVGALRPDLSAANLSAADLSNADLRRADLSAADLSGADLSGATFIDADLNGATFSDADLSNADLRRVDLRRADLSGANLSGADLSNADLRRVDLRRADLSGADLSGADLSGADLSAANLSEANLERATFVQTNLTDAALTNCRIYGIAAWSVELQGAKQHDLIITPHEEPPITVDHLEIAQFLYLMVNNPHIREVIDPIARRNAVLLLGRFPSERKAILEALRDALRKEGYLPVVFDFAKPSSCHVMETVRTLAHLSRFIIADLTDPSSITQELSAIVPTLALPVRPILLEGKREYALSLDLVPPYHWMLPIHVYKDQADLLRGLKEKVIDPAEQKAQELEQR